MIFLLRKRRSSWGPASKNGSAAFPAGLLRSRFCFALFESRNFPILFVIFWQSKRSALSLVPKGFLPYSSQLCPEGETLSSQDNAFHAAVSFGLCEDTCAGTDIITRGEAADLLYALLTREFTVAPPPILKTIPLNNKEGVHLNSYLLELQKIPEPIRQAFAERGWQYTIDYEYLAKLSEERNMSCIANQ